MRFVGDEVVRMETMSVDGKRIVKTEKAAAFDSPEYARQQPPAAQPGADTSARPGSPDTATSADQPTPKRSKPPTLKRPDEEPSDTLPPMTTPDSSPREPARVGVPAPGDPTRRRQASRLRRRRASEGFAREQDNI